MDFINYSLGECIKCTSMSSNVVSPIRFDVIEAAAAGDNIKATVLRAIVFRSKV